MDRWWVPGLTSGYEHAFVHAIADFLRGIETDQHLAGLHDVAPVLHAQLVDDAAFEVLHVLRLLSTRTKPGAIAALESGARAAQPPKPRQNTRRIRRPARTGARTGGLRGTWRSGR
jgi:hypothetical protein